RHFDWLVRFGKALCAEYTFRYGKRHASEDIIDEMAPPPEMPDAGWRDPPQAMPDICKRDDSVEAYRAYYRAGKTYFAKWTKRPVPEFMNVAEDAL
ncbi:MAG: hypothetical protein VW405_22235, partial [Rhodospirillaceae bacterium]